MSNYHIAIEPRTLQFKQPATTSRGSYTERNIWLLTLTDDERPGIIGMGECAPLPDLSCDAIPEYEHLLKAVCRQVEDSCKIDADLLRPYPSMLFGLETAQAQLAAGGSVDFFATPFGRGEEGITTNGLVWMGSFEEMNRRIEDKLVQGFGCVKLKIGAIDFEHELTLIKQVRGRFSKAYIELRVDANGAFTPANAMERLEQLARYDLHSIEQPIRQHQWADMACLCRETPLPIALDEELIGVNIPAMKEVLLDEIRPQYVVLKPTLHGGMAGCEEWIRMARRRGIGSWITSALESNVGLNSVAQFAAKMYGPHVSMPQGLGTGLLFNDNIAMPIEMRNEQLWCLKNS